MIKGNSSNREKALRIIYQANKQKVYSYILSNGGKEFDAKDVYQETMIVFYESILKNTFKEESAIGTYLYSIARFKWINLMRSKKIRVTHETEFQKEEELTVNPLVRIMDKEYQIQVEKILESLGESCKKLLIESIYLNSSMKEIAKKLNYSNEQIVRNKKYKCLQKLKELIAENPALIKILKPYE